MWLQFHSHLAMILYWNSIVFPICQLYEMDWIWVKYVHMIQKRLLMLAKVRFKTIYSESNANRSIFSFFNFRWFRWSIANVRTNNFCHCDCCGCCIVRRKLWNRITRCLHESSILHRLDWIDCLAELTISLKIVIIWLNYRTCNSSFILDDN